MCINIIEALINTLIVGHQYELIDLFYMWVENIMYFHWVILKVEDSRVAQNFSWRNIASAARQVQSLTITVGSILQAGQSDDGGIEGAA